MEPLNPDEGSMITDSAYRGPPSAEQAQALQFSRSANKKPQPRLGQVTVELPRLEPSKRKKRAQRRQKEGEREKRKEAARISHFDGGEWPERFPYEE